MTDAPEDASEAEEEAKPQYVNEVRGLLVELFKSRRREVFYDRQLQVLLERKGELDITPRNAEGGVVEARRTLPIRRNYYHWITSRALRQLAEEGRVATDVRGLGVVEEETRKPLEIRFFRYPSHRFWRRQADEITNLVREFSQPDFTHALGQQGEVLFDSALGNVGFLSYHERVVSGAGRGAGGEMGGQFTAPRV